MTVSSWIRPNPEVLLGFGFQIQLSVVLGVAVGQVDESRMSCCEILSQWPGNGLDTFSSNLNTRSQVHLDWLSSKAVKREMGASACSGSLIASRSSSI
jgi:hypothetical protein